MNVTLNGQPANENRSMLLDQLRGLAVVLMIFFHASYDLNLFGYIAIEPFHNPFWFGLPRLIVFLFLICVGIGLRSAYSQRLDWTKFWKRFSKLALCALIVSVSTYFLFPDRWIYFGTLHCIALCSLLALPLLNYPRLALVSAIVMLGFDFAGYRIPWIKLEHSSMDYIPLFPWIAVVWLGFFLHHAKLHQKHVPPIKFLEFLGKNSLVIYVIHQPLFFGLLTLISKLA
jgi:uncharacterized membrane protein